MLSYTQIKVIENRHQGSAKRVLCLCSIGILRSPTAALQLHKIYNYNTRSAGLDIDALIPLSPQLFLWAQEIVVMEQEHLDMLQTLANQWVEDGIINQNMADYALERTIVLNIPDKYSYMDPELITLIIEKYDKDKKNNSN